MASRNAPEANYLYHYVAPFSILREDGKQMDITIRAESPDSGMVSYDRVIVSPDGGESAPVQ